MEQNPPVLGAAGDAHFFAIKWGDSLTAWGAGVESRASFWQVGGPMMRLDAPALLVADVLAQQNVRRASRPERSEG